jgi:Cu/Ag efflux protein CusF
MSSLRHVRALICLSTLLACAACNRGASSASHTQGGTKRYSLKGKVISVSKQAGNASIYNDPIPGFMDPMAMPYTIKPAATLDQLQPGDSITAEVVVEPDKYWLENVQVTAHAQPPAEKSPAAPEKDQKK